MKYFILLILLIATTLTSCQNPLSTKKDTVDTPSVTATPIPEDKKDNINFEISSFKLEYEDSTKADSDYMDERYTGNGIIIASGDEILVKKPYSVLIEVNRVSGGAKRSYNEGTREITVINGIGTFTTSDWNFDKGPKMTKPVYEFKVIGYIPYIEQNK